MFTRVYLAIPEGVWFMKSFSNKSAKCCSMEKKRLVEELRKCDMSSTSYDEFHRCSREVARESGKRSRACMLS